MRRKIDLEEVARIYRMAYFYFRPPKKEVARRLGVPLSTAGRWVMLARKAGYLGPTTQRRAGV